MKLKRSATLTGLCTAAVAALLLAGGTGAQTVYDKGTSGVNDNGTLEGTCTFDPDSRYGANSVRIPSGDANRVQLTQPVLDLDMAGPYTYMCWFKNVIPGQKGLMGFGNCCSTREGYTMNITSSNIRFWGGSTINNSNYNAYSSSVPVNDGLWHHVAIRVQPGSIQILWDGGLSGSSSSSNIPTSPSLATANDLSNNVPKIGGDGISESSSAETLVDDVRIYGSWLSDPQIMDAMNNIGPLPDRLYYDFEPPAEMSILTVDTAPTEVIWGDTNIPVTVDVENTGNLDVLNVVVNLAFFDSGMTNRDSDYVVTPDPGNPTTLSVGTTETYNFTVDVLFGATIDNMTIDAVADGVDAQGGYPVHDAGADTPDSWLVRPCQTTMCGDCNLDGMVDILDSLVGAQHAALIVTLTGSEFANCNVTGPVEPDPAAVVDVLDSLLIAQFSASIPVTLACC